MSAERLWPDPPHPFAVIVSGDGAELAVRAVLLMCELAGHGPHLHADVLVRP